MGGVTRGSRRKVETYTTKWLNSWAADCKQRVMFHHCVKYWKNRTSILVIDNTENHFILVDVKQVASKLAGFLGTDLQYDSKGGWV